MRKKILVCGSAGFLMSNFMRYVIYRTKDYEFISVDILENPEDFKRVYLNRNHRFYLGDVTDEYFVNRLIAIEKPNCIINGIGCFSSQPGQLNIQQKHMISLTKSSIILSSYKIPIIQIVQDLSSDFYGFNDMISKVILTNENGCVLYLPNCFGLRQRSTLGFASIIKDLINFSDTAVRGKNLPWVYAEDVASLIWYIIENNINGKVEMPPLGFISLEKMAQIIGEEFQKKIEIKNFDKIFGEDYTSFNHGLWASPICFGPIKGSGIGGWIPDSTDLTSMIRKTVTWYKANRWALNI